MGATIDDAKGRAKEAAGAITDNDQLRDEGRRDQLGARVKDAAEHAKDTIEHVVDTAKEKFSNARSEGP